MTWKLWERKVDEAASAPVEKLPSIGICEPYYQVGDKIETRSSLIAQNKTRFAICDDGVVIWVGDNQQFSALIRQAARRSAEENAA